MGWGFEGFFDCVLKRMAFEGYAVTDTHMFGFTPAI